ncbi:MAG: exodeoxyribonuclease V subunit alpha [Pseudomonadota bacterium]
MKALDILRPARAAGALRDVDFHLARHLLAVAGESAALVDASVVALAIATLSRAQADGDICLNLAACAGRPVLADGGSTANGNWAGIVAPALATWRAALMASGLVARANINACTQPLVLDAADRLYFTKYFVFEREVAAGLLARAVDAPLADARATERLLDAQFGNLDADPDQRAAARMALGRRLAVITGGPGTGKTTTVTKMLAAMLALADAAKLPAPRVCLAAPTGKAAARLGESIRAAKTILRAAGTEAAEVMRIPEQALTLHRLIGTRPDTHRPRHNAANPLALDVLVIDEASMIDMPLMARVMAALPATARLVLLGDADQLASVEAGAVLGDICRRMFLHADDHEDAATTVTASIAGSIARLRTSHRFRGDGGIGALARAINAGDASAALAACAGDPATRLFAGNDATALDALVARAVRAYRHYLAATDVVDAAQRFGAFRVLCALRDGSRGVAGINARVTAALADAGLIDPRERFYRGRPLLITANDYGVQLFNGDIGLVWPAADGHLHACFVAADRGLRWLPLGRLPAHETVFAMTVHKAQGSEFDTVALVLPERDAPVLGCELIYTAVTRARAAVEIHGNPALLVAAISRRIARSSGLQDALWD